MNASLLQRRFTRGALLLLGLGVSLRAEAYCQTTTCDPADETQVCEVDDNGCEVSGKPLSWSSSCVSFGVQKDGSPLRGITFDEAHAVIENSFSRWTEVDCGGGAHPSIKLDDRGTIICSEPEYNTDAPNANVWMFRDSDWPYKSDPLPGGFVDTSQLAVTGVTFNTETGEIYDADAEFNSELVPFSLPGEDPSYDFDSIVTHEIGHFFGLSHSLERGSTMEAIYNDQMSTLSPDDEEGICALYPPGRETTSDSCTPRHGFTSECGVSPDTGCCSTAPGRPTPSDARGPWLMTFVTALFGAAAWRRRVRRTA